MQTSQFIYPYHHTCFYNLIIFMNKTTSNPRFPYLLNYSSSSPHFNTSLNSKSASHLPTKYLVSDSPFQIIPSQIQFTDVAVGQIYEVTVNIRNLTRKSQKIRLIPPGKNIQIRCNIEQPIAAGLTSSIIVTYECKVAQCFKDRLKIMGMTVPFQIQISIQVITPTPNFIFEPYINFGFVKTGKSKIEEIMFKNEGKMQGQVQLLMDNTTSYFQLLDRSAIIKPGEEKSLRVKFHPQENGTFKSLILVKPANKIFSEIELSATSMQFSKFLIDKEGKQISSINFPLLYSTQSWKQYVQIVNNSPKRVKWRLVIKRIGNKIQFPTPNQMGKQQTERALNCQPVQGIIKPYSKEPIKMIWKGKTSEDQQAVFQKTIKENYKESNLVRDKSFNVFIQFDSIGEDKIAIQTNVRCVIPSIKISRHVFSFNNCPVGSKFQIPFEIQNMNRELPISLSFQKTMHFQVKPEKATLEPLQIYSFTAEFAPKVIGQLYQNLRITVVEGLFTYLKLVGQATGWNSARKKSILPEEFLCQSSIVPVPQGESWIQETKEKNVMAKKKPFMEGVLNQFRLKRMNQTQKGRQQKKDMSSVVNQEQEKNLPPFSIQTFQQAFKETRLKLPKIEDLVIHELQKQAFKPTEFNPLQRMRLLHDRPKNNNQQRNINSDLKPQILKQIEVGPRQIDYGRIFIFSDCIRFFHLINHSQQHISLRLIPQSLGEALSLSETRSQIVSPKAHAGIEIKAKPFELGQKRQIVKYIINQKHIFQFVVSFQCTPVILKLLRNQIKIVFGEEDHAFQKQQKSTISNEGSGRAQYSWVHTKQKIFSISPESGSLLPGESVQFVVTYNPSQSTKESISSITRTEQQKLKLKVKDGIDIMMKCVGMINETKLMLKQSEINLKEVSINKVIQVKISIKNISRSNTVFQIRKSKTLENILTINQTKELLASQQTKELIAEVFSVDQQVIEGQIVFIPRAGKEVRLPIKGKIVTPQVQIVQEVIDFGDVTVHGDASTKFITLRNLSSFDVQIVTLNQNQENLKISVPEQADQVSLREQAGESSFKLLAKAQIKLILKFTPTEVKKYQMQLPLSLKAKKLSAQNLKKTVFGCGIKPILVVQPQKVDFNRLIISSQDSSFKYSQIQMFNTSANDLQWSMEEINGGPLQPFSLSQKSGVIQKKAALKIRVTFRPLNPGVSIRNLGVFLKSSEGSKLYLTISIKGTADYPKIMFDRRQIIMPVVPLNTQSKFNFYIFNDGYQNLRLNHNIVQQMTNIPVSLKFPQGSNLGVTKKSLKIQASFTYKKPVSFTLKLQFIDDANRIYSIPISGTTDNSVMTLDSSWQNSVTKTYEKGEYYHRSDTLIQRDCQFLCRYLNNLYFASQPLKQFPGSIVAHEGDQIFQLVGLFLKNDLKKKSKISNKKARLKSLWKNYCQLIKMLKLEGALLNNIRPQFLLSKSDFLVFLSEFQLGNFKEYQFTNTQLAAQFSGVPIKNYQNIHMESWITLLFQVFKLFVLSSISPKTYLSTVIPGITKLTIPQEIAKIDDGLESQKLLMLWLEMVYQSQLLQSKKPILKNLNEGSHLAVLIGRYTSFFVTSQFLKIYKPQDKKKRCQKIIQALLNLGVNCPFTVEDLMLSSQKINLLLVSQLFNTLPNYLPKQQIVFSCNLGQSEIKSIQITNPSKKTISYWAKLQGSKDFSIQSEDNFSIAPKKNFFFKVKFVSKLSTSSQAVLTFTSKKDSAFVGALVFSLKSNIIGRFSQKIWHITSTLYQTSEFNIPIENTFGVECDFQVLLNCEGLNLNDTYNEPYQSNFYIKTNRLKIKKGQTEQLTVLFIPILMDTHRCTIVFIDPLVGQFQHQITANVEFPLTSSQFIIRPPLTYVDQQGNFDFLLPIKNQSLSKAKKAIQALDKGKRKPSLKDEEQSYDLQVVSNLNFISISPNARINPNADEKNSREDDIKRKVSLKLQFKVPAKDFITFILVKSHDNLDIRKYKAIINATFRPIKVSLTMRCQLKQQVSQAIPLINNMQKQTTYSINFSQDSKPGDARYSNNFLLQYQKDQRQKQKDTKEVRDILVPAATTVYFTVVFKPKVLWHPDAKIVAHNSLSSEQFQYEIKGVVEDHLQSQNLNIKLNCGSQGRFHVQLSNSNNVPINFKVAYSTQEISGAPTFFLPSLSTERFSFLVRPLRIGNLEGWLEFKDQQGAKLIYNVYIDTSQTPVSQKLDIYTKEREVGFIQLPLVNPLKIQQTFRISIQNCNQIACPNLVQVPPETSVPIKLQYKPFTQGIRSTFMSIYSEKLCQKRYSLKLICQPAAPIRLPQFKVQLGSTSFHQVVLNNPLSQIVELKIKKTNPSVFYSDPQEVTLMPKSNSTVKLYYSPSNLSLQFGQIFFSSSKIGSWNYMLYGIGVIPTQSPPIEVQTQLFDDKILFVNFKNPFKYMIEVTIELQKDLDVDSNFKVVLKNALNRLQEAQSIQVPIVFTPRTMRLYRCRLKVVMNQKISWFYPVVGTVLSYSERPARLLKCKCRETKKERQQIKLNDLDPNFLSKSYRLQFKNFPASMARLIQKFIVVQPVNVKLNSSQEKLQWKFRFVPMKPFKTYGDIHIIDQFNNIWSYKIVIQAVEPQSDDTILLQADIQTKSTVAFRLTNKIRQTSPFKAYFTPETDLDFFISPTSGELMPFGREGTQFQISFIPSQYKKLRKGKLVIETQQMYWSYQLQGTLPKYIPPKK